MRILRKISNFPRHHPRTFLLFLKRKSSAFRHLLRKAKQNKESFMKGGKKEKKTIKNVYFCDSKRKKNVLSKQEIDEKKF
jgi:hypothetical protein